MPPKLRLFLALFWPDAAVCQQLADHAAGWTWPPGCARYVPLDWHVTLHFIGPVPSEHVPTLAAGVHVGMEPFTLRLDQPALWHRGLAVLGASRLPPPLRQLHDRLADALRRQGVAIDTRPFRPHVTLARQAHAAQAPTAFRPVEWCAQGYVLAVSTGDHSARYQVLHRYGGS